VTAAFDLIIAPALSDEVLRYAVETRRRPTIAQRWIRDNVVFAWRPWSGPAEQPAKGIGIEETRLRRLLAPASIRSVRASPATNWSTTTT
jgi:hypothetical protein